MPTVKVWVVPIIGARADGSVVLLLGGEVDWVAVGLMVTVSVELMTPV